MTALVAAGVPLTVVAVWATRPTYGVTVYEMIMLPPFGGAVHVTVADSSPATATTPLGVPGTFGGVGVGGAQAASSRACQMVCVRAPHEVR